MHLQKLRISNFRSYKKKEVSFTSHINCIEGANGSGKSNLLEAIYLISTGKSFRTHKLQDLIQHETSGFQIDVDFVKEGIINRLQILFSPEGRKILYNQTAHTSFIPLLGILPTILLSPEDISIIDGSPAERRRFLDIHLAQIDPLYVYHLGRYQRALKQRNILLKKQEEKGLAVWEELMATSAAYLIEKRLETIKSLEEPGRRHVLDLSKQKEPFSMQYESSFSLPEDSQIPLSISFAKQWATSRRKELEAKTTLLGPHRDDILFFIDSKEVKTFCSEGQKRCCLAALRLGQWERHQNLLQKPPLFGIDDFGIHLDEERSFLLRKSLEKMGQVFLTAPSFLDTEEIHLPPNSLKTCMKIRVENTQIPEENS